MQIPPIRSMLFVPGNRLSLIEKAKSRGADAVVIDLEDAVPMDAKERARREVAEFLQSQVRENYPFFVRVNGLESPEAGRDIAAVVTSGLTGIMVPKLSAPESIHTVEHLLRWAEEDNEVHSKTTITPVFETALGIRNAFGICIASERVAYAGGLGVRGGDVERAIGYKWTPESRETFVLRSKALLDVRAANVSCPLAGLWTDINDLSGLRRFATENRQIGYEGMSAIHPSHVEVINEVFTPTEQELQRDHDLVETFEAASREGRGAVVFEGEMIDEAMAETSRSRIKRYGKGKPE